MFELTPFNMLLARDWTLYLVVSDEHPPGQVVAVPKYTLSSKPSPWRYRRLSIERLIGSYSAKGVREKAKLIYDPSFDSKIPVLSTSEVIHEHRCRERSREILHKQEDEVEEAAAELLRLLLSSNIPISCLGLTGSLLIRAQNPAVSDVDLVVYQPYIEKAVETLEAEAEPLPDSVFKEWCLERSRALGVEPNLIAKAYRKWRRGVIAGRVFSVSYARPCTRRYAEEPLTVLGEATLKLEVEPRNPEALAYPSRIACRVLGCLESPIKGFKDVLVVCYEATFSSILWDGGVVVARGALAKRGLGGYALVIGAAEAKGLVVVKE